MFQRDVFLKEISSRLKCIRALVKLLGPNALEYYAKNERLDKDVMKLVEMAGTALEEIGEGDDENGSGGQHDEEEAT